jgi:hypothetical protein
MSSLPQHPEGASLFFEQFLKDFGLRPSVNEDIDTPSRASQTPKQPRRSTILGKLIFLRQIKLGSSINEVFSSVRVNS